MAITTVNNNEDIFVHIIIVLMNKCLILSMLVSWGVHAQEILTEPTKRAVSFPRFLQQENDRSLQGDVKIDFFQLPLGRIGGGVEYYHPSRPQGMYLSANLYSHILYESFNDDSWIPAIAGDGPIDTTSTTSDDSEGLNWTTWNVSFDYRFYKRSSKTTDRLLFVAPYIRFQQSLVTYSNSMNKQITNSTEAVALGVSIGRRKYFGKGRSFEWYLGGGFFVPISGSDVNAYLGQNWSLRHGLLFSFGH